MKTYQQKDYIHEKFGSLTICNIGEIKGAKGRRKRFVIARCICGVIKEFSLSNILQGFTRSCGCVGKIQRIKAITKHGLTRHPIHAVWTSMKQRCYNESNKSYNYYGGRGISVCQEWENDFMVFYNWVMQNGYKNGLTIDRINNDGNYEPSNCRFVTQSIQVYNRRRIPSKIMIPIICKETLLEYDSISAASRAIGISKTSLIYSLNKGKSINGLHYKKKTA